MECEWNFQKRLKHRMDNDIKTYFLYFKSTNAHNCH